MNQVKKGKRYNFTLKKNSFTKESYKNVAVIEIIQLSKAMMIDADITEKAIIVNNDNTYRPDSVYYYVLDIGDKTIVVGSDWILSMDEVITSKRILTITGASNQENELITNILNTLGLKYEIEDK